jgi:hypothetical protein
MLPPPFPTSEPYLGSRRISGSASPAGGTPAGRSRDRVATPRWTRAWRTSVGRRSRVLGHPRRSRTSPGIDRSRRRSSPRPRGSMSHSRNCQRSSAPSAMLTGAEAKTNPRRLDARRSSRLSENIVNTTTVPPNGVRSAMKTRSTGSVGVAERSHGIFTSFRVHLWRFWRAVERSLGAPSDRSSACKEWRDLNGHEIAAAAEACTRITSVPIQEHGAAPTDGNVTPRRDDRHSPSENRSICGALPCNGPWASMRSTTTEAHRAPHSQANGPLPRSINPPQPRQGSPPKVQLTPPPIAPMAVPSTKFSSPPEGLAGCCHLPGCPCPCDGRLLPWRNSLFRHSAEEATARPVGALRGHGRGFANARLLCHSVTEACEALLGWRPPRQQSH